MDWLELVGLIVAVVGIASAYLLGRNARKTPRIAYGMDFDVLIDPTSGELNRGLSMTFRNVPVTRVTRTYFAVWHERGDTVNRGDMVAADPLRLDLDSDDEPLQVTIVNKSRSVNDLQVHIRDHSVVVDFDFLDKGDGGIIEVIHHGAQPRSVGTIRGADLRDAGELTLTPTALQWMRNPRTAARFRERLRAAHVLPTFVTSIVAALLLLGTGIFVLAGGGWGNGHLVSLTKYNLKVGAGQEAFANAVQAAQRSPGTEGIAGWLLISFAIFLFLLPLFVGIFIFRFSRIPRSIVMEPGGQ